MNRNFNGKYRVAIHQNDGIYKHSNSWNFEWINYCNTNGIEYEIVDCYSNEILKKLKGFDYLLWHFGNYSLQDMLFARSILYVTRNMGLKIFPDFNTAWHFDDKVAEYYLLNSIDAPIPDSWVFYTKEECINWLKNTAQYPVVAKLRSGSGSNNVRLIKNVRQGISYANKMFNGGLRNVPGLFFKAKSNLKSSKNWETFRKRYKRIPEFLKTRENAKKLPRERGYVYLQDYIPNDGFDVRIVVIGDKLSFGLRHVRKGDFRASGGGSSFYDKTIITPEIISFCFETYDRLQFQCIGFDVVIDKNSNKAKITEISYGFPHLPLMQAQGFWDRSGTWYDGNLNAPVEVLKNLLKSNNNNKNETYKGIASFS